MSNCYLITGASSDVGMALLRRLYRDGDIFLCQGAGDTYPLRVIGQTHPGIFTFDVDLGSESSVEQFIAEVRKNYPTPTHLVHLPALRVVNTKFKNFDEERFATDFCVQVTSSLKLCKAFIPGMAKSHYGRVLFMLTDYLLDMPPRNTAAYVMAKSAVQGLMKSLAADYAAAGVTVNGVAPSMMQTKFLADTSPLIVEAAAAAHPMKRNARVEDVIPAMEFLLSEEAGFITGVTLPVTGGLHI